MTGGMNNEMIEAPMMSQLRNNTCCVLPTWFEEIKSTICAGITIGNSAADWALRPNHSTFRISCPPMVRRESFAWPLHPADILSLSSFTEYIHCVLVCEISSEIYTSHQVTH